MAWAKNASAQDAENLALQNRFEHWNGACSIQGEYDRSWLQFDRSSGSLACKCFARFRRLPRGPGNQGIPPKSTASPAARAPWARTGVIGIPKIQSPAAQQLQHGAMSRRWTATVHSRAQLEPRDRAAATGRTTLPAEAQEPLPDAPAATAPRIGFPAPVLVPARNQ